MPEQTSQNTQGKLSSWLANQPGWFSFALHIAARGGHSPEDVDDLAAAACAEAGLSIPVGAPESLVGFREEDISAPGKSHREVILEEVTAVNNVNALEQGASLTFAQSGLTVVYGENGSGKSGFCRLIRNASTSRSGPSPILRNVFEQGDVSEATYAATVDGEHRSFTWAEGEGDHPRLPEIMFFDAECAATEIRGKKNDVLYVPPILSALVRLSALVADVGNRLKQHADSLPTAMPRSAIPADLLQVKLISDLVESNDPERARELLAAKALTADGATRMDNLPKAINSDPSAEIPKLEAQRDQLNQLRTALGGLYKACSDKLEADRNAAAVELEAAKKAADAVRKELADASSTEGVGTDAWKTLWRAARDYAESCVHPDADFPNLGEGAVCPLCQQPLSQDAKDRMSAFDKFMEGAAQKNLSDKKAVLEAIESSFANAVRDALDIRPCIPIVSSEDAREELNGLLDTLSEIEDIPDMPAREEIGARTAKAGTEVRAEIDALESRIEALREQAEPGAVERYKLDLLDLRARAWAQSNSQAIMADVETRCLKGQIELVRKSCTTRNISKLVSELSQTEVIERMQECFARELSELQAPSQPVRLSARVQSGREYQELSLEGAIDNVASSQVLSEGEQKIAANKESTPITYRTVSRRGTKAGVVHDDLAWGASSVTQRIKALNARADEIAIRAKNDEFEDDGEFEELMRKQYDYLRAAWERAIEEVLLYKIVERTQPPVQTQRLRYLLDVSQDDVDIVDRSMTKCSTITAAHDDPLEAPDDVPGVTELRADIKELKDWIAQVRDRHKKRR